MYFSKQHFIPPKKVSFCSIKKTKQTKKPTKKQQKTNNKKTPNQPTKQTKHKNTKRSHQLTLNTRKCAVVLPGPLPMSSGSEFNWSQGSWKAAFKYLPFPFKKATYCRSFATLNSVMCSPNINSDISCAALSSHPKEVKQNQATLIFKICRWFCLFLVPPFPPCNAPLLLLPASRLQNPPKLAVDYQRKLWESQGSQYISTGETQVLLYSMHLLALPITWASGFALSTEALLKEKLTRRQSNTSTCKFWWEMVFFIFWKILSRKKWNPENTWSIIFLLTVSRVSW